VKREYVGYTVSHCYSDSLTAFRECDPTQNMRASKSTNVERMNECFCSAAVL